MENGMVRTNFDLLSPHRRPYNPNEFWADSIFNESGQMFFKLARFVGCVAIILLAGCQMRPQGSWAHPGPHEVQRSRAMLHDPYPDTMAGPEMTGVRPHDFQLPTPEAVKNQPYGATQWFPY